MCDTTECQAAKIQECRAEFYCYVSFRPARSGERKSSATSKMMYGAGSQLFIAEHRGCVQPDQLEDCQELASGAKAKNRVIGGGFDNLNANEDGHSRWSIVRCCRDSWCNTDQVSHKITLGHIFIYKL